MKSSEPLLSVRNLKVVARMGSARATVLDGIDFTLSHGEILGIVGESGSGKSTLCRTLARILPNSLEVESGKVTLAGRDILGPDPRDLHLLGKDGVGMVFQDPAGALNPVMRVGDQIVEALLARGEIDRKAGSLEAVKLLERMGIGEPEKRFYSYPHELSRGQQQRLVFAIALAGGMAVLLADEPTSALDVRTQAQILSLIHGLTGEGLGVLFVSHDIATVAQICSRVLVLYAGRICEVGPTEDLLTKPRHPYTKALIGALPDVARRRERLDVIPGQHPVVGEPVPGCPFHPRCNYVEEVCRHTSVSLVPISSSHESACLRVNEIWEQDDR